MTEDEARDAAIAGLTEKLRQASEAVTQRITREINALIENALAPAKGLGLLPIAIDGRPATPLERVRAIADRVASWDRDVTALAHAIVTHPTLRREIRAGESAIAFATRKLLETPR